ncbi:MAG: HD domain-containing protein [Fischerella sp.]|nr:HD domain-containing protein [Fischerella sp.]
MKDLITEAREFAAAAHARVNQRRKYTDQPYIVHPAEVAKILSDHGCNKFQIAAGWLHDVVEDTGVDILEIRERFGSTVACLVYYCTDISKPIDGNRAVRKEIDRRHAAQGPTEAHDIKLADMISNLSSIAAHDPNFAKTYVKEKRALFESITGKASLRRITEDLIVQIEQQLF